MSLAFESIHIIGAGGAGMSAIAKVLVGMGHHVSGSDQRGGASLDRLEDYGVEVHTGHHPQVARAADLVVVSSAVPENDPELSSAREQGVPVWRRPQLLSALTRMIPTIGATGTHGKTTTTALLIAGLRSSGLDPSFIVGGDLVDLATNGHHGTDHLLVLEADEAFRTFEELEMVGLVITNVEAEHLEHFGGEEAMHASFAQVASAVRGPVLACLDDPGAARVAAEVGVSTYGTSPHADWSVSQLRRQGMGSRFRLKGPGVDTEVSVSRPGRHVAMNAAGALALLASLGFDLAGCLPGIGAFRGVARRWEHRGTVGGVVLIDDYAHHPTEVAATLGAAEGMVEGRIWAVFQPHLYSRTERFHDRFGEALSRADVVVVTDVYGSREEPVPGVTGELVAEAVRRRGTEVHYLQHRSDLAGFIAGQVTPGDLVLSMGAGDITVLHTELASALAERG